MGEAKTAGCCATVAVPQNILGQRCTVAEQCTPIDIALRRLAFRPITLWLRRGRCRDPGINAQMFKKSGSSKLKGKLTNRISFILSSRGLSIQTPSEGLNHRYMVRSMPNTPAQIAWITV
jgi:hypothetical protein